MRSVAWLTVSILCCAGCASRSVIAPPCQGRQAVRLSQGSEMAPDHSEAEGSDTRIEDQQRMQRLLAEGSKLVDSGKAVRMSVLIEQLHRTSCRIDLAAPSRTLLSAEQLYERMCPSIVIIGTLYYCENCKRRHVGTASGFIIAASGACVTNYHVVNDPKKEALIALTSDDRIVPVQAVLAASRTDDIAILQLRGRGFRPLALSTGAKPGQQAYVISHPNKQFFALTEGIISRCFTVRHGRDNPSPRMSITADYAKGSSGAPVFDNRGTVVGVAKSTTSIHYNEKDGQKTNLQMVVKECIPAASVLKLIEQ